jgi:hypothetical protein
LAFGRACSRPIGTTLAPTQSRVVSIRSALGRRCDAVERRHPLAANVANATSSVNLTIVLLCGAASRCLDLLPPEYMRTRSKCQPEFLQWRRKLLYLRALFNRPFVFALDFSVLIAAFRRSPPMGDFAALFGNGLLWVPGPLAPEMVALGSWTTAPNGAAATGASRVSLLSPILLDCGVGHSHDGRPQAASWPPARNTGFLRPERPKT